jgi:microcystin-dependent protein
MTLYKWSQLAAADATADATINWQEGQAPSSINDSARGMMAAAAKWRDDITGIAITSGSGAAYTISSNQLITSNTNGFTVQFTPGVTNTGAVTLSVDGQTAQPLRFLTSVDLPAGVLISGSLYQATYRSAAGEWLLHSFNSSIYSIPIGGGLDYWGATTPNGSFAFAQGQTISATVYAGLFAIIGTTYNTGGEPGGTFRLPDKVGRVSAMRDGGSARLSASYFGGNPANLGAVGGTESQGVSISNINSFTPTGTFSASLASGNAAIPMRIYSGTIGASDNTHISAGNNAGSDAGLFNAAVTGSVSGSVSMNALGSGAAHNNVQPTIICNYIIRVL